MQLGALPSADGAAWTAGADDPMLEPDVVVHAPADAKNGSDFDSWVATDDWRSHQHWKEAVLHSSSPSDVESVAASNDGGDGLLALKQLFAVSHSSTADSSRSPVKRSAKLGLHFWSP